MEAEKLWKEFLRGHPEHEGDTYVAWSYGAAPDDLADLTLKGIKTATASAYSLYELENEPLPKPGDFNIIMNSKDEAVCIIRTTRVNVMPFDEVDEDFAWKEGEGDRSLQYWRKAHIEFFKGEYARHGMAFDEKIKVVCEEFERVY